jgi:hypothetical protein
MMKAFLTFLILVLIYSCNGFDSLNNNIFEAQKLAVHQSPYKSANETNLETQKVFRLNKLPKLIRDKIYTTAGSKDTILITESFDATCMNCPSYWMSVLYRDTIYTLARKFAGGNKIDYKPEAKPFIIAPKDFDSVLRSDKFFEIVNKIKKKESWKADPLQYGADDCHEGDDTFVTVIYPNKKIESLYIRCWLPPLYRTPSLPKTLQSFKQNGNLSECLRQAGTVGGNIFKKS